MAVLSPVFAGLGTGLSLIVAIGAQNAFVLRQGIRREHVVPVVVICIVSDLVLITLGVAGVTTVLRELPQVESVVRLLGAAFLIGYGLLAARRVLRPAALTPDGDGSAGSWQIAVLTCLAVTWLNPHTYLDAVLLLGTIAHSWDGQRWWFGVGAVAGSVLWFAVLGFGARLLRGFFARPAAWRVLDGLIAATMLTLGVLLAVNG